MATAKPARSRRKWRIRFIWTVLTIAALLAAFREPIIARAVLSASYGAHIACSCHHIGGRPLKSCREDFESGMGLILLSEDEEARSVTARFPLLSSQTATFVEGQGCLLEPWRD